MIISKLIASFSYKFCWKKIALIDHGKYIILELWYEIVNYVIKEMHFAALSMETKFTFMEKTLIYFVVEIWFLNK